MGKRAIITTVATVVTVLTGMIIFSKTNNAPVDYGKYSIRAIEDLSKALPKENLNPDTFIEATADSGNLPDKTIGDPTTAKLVVYEYADYTCPHCVEWSRALDKMVDKSNGELAVVYRGYLRGSVTGVVAASAATAAQIQGCWREYKELLFANQSEWSYLNGEELKNELIVCFEKASKNQGDVDKFKADMASENVAKKIAFEQRLGDEIGLTGTPTFRIDGETIEIKNLKSTIEQKLAKL